LAVTLAPHIDWSIPAATEAKRREPTQSLIFLLLTLAVAAVLLVPTVRDLGDYRLYSRIDIWRNTSFLVLIISAMAILVTSAVGALLAEPVHLQRAKRVQLANVGLSLLAIISLGLANAAHYQFQSSNGWRALIATPAALAGLIFGIIIVLGYVPEILISKWPSLSSNAIRGGVDIIVVVLSPIVSWAAWAGRDSFPPLHLIPLVIVGVLQVYIGFRAIRTGKPFWFSDEIVSLGGRVVAGKDSDNANWVKWINSHLPDPEQQKALKRTLDEAHPRSRAQTLGGIIVFGAGGWLLATVLGGVIQTLVQHVLDPLLN
jgi:hypothetical protein